MRNCGRREHESRKLGGLIVLAGALPGHGQTATRSSLVFFPCQMQPQEVKWARLAVSQMSGYLGVEVLGVHLLTSLQIRPSYECSRELELSLLLQISNCTKIDPAQTLDMHGLQDGGSLND